MDEKSGSIKRRLNVDFIMSACALLISVIACATALYQLRMASTMASAQTWPYLTTGWHYDTGQTGITVTNDGQGLAIVEAVEFRVDSQPQHDVLSALRKIVSGADGTVQADAVVHGSVIRPGQTLRLMEVRGADWDRQLLAAKTRISFDLCYCSVLGRCWTSAIGDLPEQVNQCEMTSSLALPEVH